LLHQPSVELVLALRLDFIQLLHPFLANAIAEAVEAVFGMRNKEEAEGADADFDLQSIVCMAAGVGKGRSEKGPKFESQEYSPHHPNNAPPQEWFLNILSYTLSGMRLEYRSVKSRYRTEQTTD